MGSSVHGDKASILYVKVHESPVYDNDQRMFKKAYAVCIFIFKSCGLLFMFEYCCLGVAVCHNVFVDSTTDWR